MAIASKPKKSNHYKKTQARHHRHSKHYLKPYWPYLPMFAILGAGAYLERNWPAATAGLLPQGQDSATLASSHLDQLTGQHAALLSGLVLAAAVVALAIFMLRNSLRLHRVVVRSEHFVSDRPLLDIAVVAVFTAGLVLVT